MSCVLFRTRRRVYESPTVRTASATAPERMLAVVMHRLFANERMQRHTNTVLLQAWSDIELAKRVVRGDAVQHLRSMETAARWN